MTIVDEAKLFVIDYFEKNKSEKLLFHSLEHTMNVVRHAEQIGRYEKLSEEELQAVLVAAWFHDTGYLVQHDNHEEASKAIVRSFFEAHPVDPRFTELTERCIDITKRQEEPAILPEKVILDADVSHIGNAGFISISKKLKKEYSLYQEREISSLEYWEGTLRFLEKQSFYTSYAQQYYLPEKGKNMQTVASMIDEIRNKETDAGKKGKKKVRTPEKGIESMFRLTASNQMRLTAIADKKANILISINSILGSVSAAIASLQPFSQGKITIPVIILFISSISSLVFAILSCRPKLSSRKYSVQDVKERKMNLLFFGNFYQIAFPQYLQAMREMMEDYDYLYSNMIKDQYYLGLSLYRKYKLLRIAYNIFMFGFVAAATAFIIILFFFQ